MSLSQQMQIPARSDVLARMADFLTAHAAAHGGVTEDELLLQFTPEQIATHLPAAKKRAQNVDKASRQ